MSSQPFKDFLDTLPRDVSTVRGCSHSAVCSVHLVKRVLLHLQEDLREFVHTLVPFGSKVLSFELVEITAMQQDITCPLRHSDNRKPARSQGQMELLCSRGSGSLKKF